MMTRTEFVILRDGIASIAAYKKLMRSAYRAAVIILLRKEKGWRTHPYRRKWIEGYLEFKKPIHSPLICIRPTP